MIALSLKLTENKKLHFFVPFLCRYSLDFFQYRSYALHTCACIMILLVLISSGIISSSCVVVIVLR